MQRCRDGKDEDSPRGGDVEGCVAVEHGRGEEEGAVEGDKDREEVRVHARRDRGRRKGRGAAHGQNRRGLLAMAKQDNNATRVKSSVRSPGEQKHIQVSEGADKAYTWRATRSLKARIQASAASSEQSKH